MRRLPLASLVFLLVTGCFPDHHPVQPPDELLFDEFTAQTVIVDESAILPGLVGGESNGAWALNQHGFIAGYSSTATARVPAVWEGGSVRRLSSEGGGLPPGRATGVNNRREVVGWIDTEATPSVRRPYFWSGATPRELDTWDFSGYRGWALGVNDAGQIVGGLDWGDYIDAVLWPSPDASAVDLWPPCDWEYSYVAEARAINAGGQVVGFCQARDSGGGLGIREGALWEGSSSRILPPPVEFQASVEPQDINDLGLVAGYVVNQVNSQSYAVIWPDGAEAPATLIGPGFSRAFGVNNLGQVVGEVAPELSIYYPALWMDGLLYMLGTPDGRSARALSISDDGVVVGDGRDSSTSAAYRWQVPIRAGIEVEPGSDAVRLGGGGKVTVAVYGSPYFSVAQLDLATLTLGNENGNDTPVLRGNNGRIDARITDTNRDGHPDLLLSFDRRQLVANGDLTSSTERLFLTGRRLDGKPIRGVGGVTVRP